MWECRSDSAEEVSYKGCHTRHEDSFLFSVSYLRRWHRSGPVWLRSLQPNCAGSGRLHVASRFLCVCSDWPKTHQFLVFSGIHPAPFSLDFPSHEQAQHQSVMIISGGEQQSPQLSAFGFWLQTRRGQDGEVIEEPGCHLGTMYSRWKS